MFNIEVTPMYAVLNKDEKTAKKEQVIAYINEKYAKYVAKKAELFSKAITAAANLKTAKINFLNPVQLDKSKVDTLAYDPFAWTEAMTNLANKESKLADTLKPYEDTLAVAQKEYTLFVTAGVKAKFEETTADIDNLSAQVESLLA